ncbi:hypothetical protein NY78_3814 [Desulfovibrio sp. TomC]|nr:hypothetical protein NY78_3814 [Desulfovibrio sp. TomC]
MAAFCPAKLCLAGQNAATTWWDREILDDTRLAGGSSAHTGGPSSTRPVSPVLSLFLEPVRPVPGPRAGWGRNLRAAGCRALAAACRP